MATTTKGLGVSGNLNENEGTSNESVKGDAKALNSGPPPEDTEAKARVEAMWNQMNKGIPKDFLVQFSGSNSSTKKRPSPQASNNWMKYLQLGPPKAAGSPGQETQTDARAQSAVKDRTSENTQLQKVDKGNPNDMPKSVLDECNSPVDTKSPHSTSNNNISDEAKKLAAAALSAVKDAAAAASNRGKIEIMEVRDFAGQEIEFRKRIDAESKEAEKAKATAPSAVDAVLEQIKKKPKLSVLDKTRKDWGEFKEENKGMEEELDAYKKSSNQYLDKVSFLQRADYREFERERDARLALQSRRRSDMREDP